MYGLCNSVKDTSGHSCTCLFAKCLSKQPDKPVVCVQNPVNTMSWISANFQLLGPIISLALDTRQFVQRIFSTALVLLFAVVQTALANVAILAGPAVHANVFGLYHFPAQFRFNWEALGLIAVLYSFTCLTVTRRLLTWHQQRRVQPLHSMMAFYD